MTFLQYYSLTEWVLRLVMLAVILRGRHRAPTAIAWLMVAFFVPEVGFPLYLLIGNNRLGKRRVKKHRRVVQTLRSTKRLAKQAAHIARPRLAPEHQPMVLQAESIGGFHTLAGNEIELLSDSDTFIDRLIADIDAAARHVHLLYYIFASDQVGRRVCEALIRAKQRGVNCRVLADAAGSRGFFSRHGPARTLRERGIQAVEMLPVSPLRSKLARIDLRNHRKLAVIDGAVAYTGSQNIVNPDYGRRGLRWIDLSGRLTGPIVNQLQMVFLEDWAFDTGEHLDEDTHLLHLTPTGKIIAQTIPTGPSYESDALPAVLLAAIHSARRKLIITTPYLVPDEPTILGLAMAAQRGVEVQLVIPEKSDHPLVKYAARAYYEELLDAGVNIHLHHLGLLHAKTMTVDDSLALLGSSNLDVRSFYLNFELNVLMYGPEITRHLRFAQTRYINESTKLDRDTWAKRNPLSKYAENAAALLSPLL